MSTRAAHNALALAILLVFIGVFGVKATPPPLQSYNVPLSGITVSGLSAGAFFAVQVHVTYSSKVSGAAAFAGGPYHCAEGILETALSTCMEGLPPPENLLYFEATTQKAASGYIDPVSNLKDANVFLFSGMEDKTVMKTVVDHLALYYQHFLGNDTSLKYITDVGAGHTMPTLNYGNPCQQTGSPFIGNCNYDGAGAALQQIYGTLNPPNRGNLTGKVLQFNQHQFVASDISMPATGFLYVPAACASGTACRLHVSFHGCLQGYGSVGTDYVVHAGYNEWADTNNIIVLYPQASLSPLIPYNPKGCWNWWGYNDNMLGYDDKRGLQMKGVWAMVEQIASGSSAARH